MKRSLPLLALAFGAFGIGVTEFAPMGLLPTMAADLRVSLPAAGLLVTAYALGVMIGAPLITLATARAPRKVLMVALIGLFTLGNLLTAIAPDYWSVMAGRVLTSLCHGTFFGVGAVIAASLAPPERRAAAVASMFMGLTLANVGGVPLAAWLGEMMGWRAVFFGMAGLGLAIMATTALALPRCPGAAALDLRAEVAALSRPSVIVALLVTVLASGAMFTVFTYIAAILHDRTHVSPAFIAACLVIYGLGLTVGNGLGGRFADLSLDKALIVTLALLCALLVLFSATMAWPLWAAATIFAWGVATFALVPPLQVRVLSAAEGAPNLVSSVNIGAFNLGNALGAALGGGVIALDLGYGSVALAGAALACAALLLVLTGLGRSRQPQPVAS